MTVAEIGCGEGGNLKPFLDLGCHIVGIDIAENKIENLNELLLSNKSQNDEILQIVNIVNKSIESNKNSSNSLFVQIASKLSLEELENIIKEKNSIKEKIKTESDAA